MPGLNIRKYCRKLFYLMDSFLETIAGADIDIDW